MVDAIKRLTEVTGVRYSQEQLDVLNHQGGMCIMACAGSGKTTILTHLIAKRCLTGEIDNIKNLLCTTYSQAGRTELKDRLVKLLAQLGLDISVNIKTIHATYLEILKHFNVPVKQICTEGKKMQFVSEALKQMGVNMEEDDKEVLASLFSYQVNNLMSDAELIKSSAYTLENFSLQQYTQARTIYVDKKVKEGLLDFDDLQMLVYRLMVNQPNQAVIDYCRNKFKYIYVDEFQDTSKIQFAILRQMIDNEDNLVVIGDDDQSIYGWRGADPSIILNICGYFPIKKFVLSTNYRCCGNIVELAANGIKNNIERVEKDMKPFNKGGELKLCATPRNLFGITKNVFVHIQSLIESGVKPEEIAVLCRNNRQSTILGNMLVDSDIYYKTTSDAMKFTKLPMYKDIKALFNIVDTDFDAASASSVLWKLVPFIGHRGASAITMIMDSCNIGLRDSVWYVLSHHTVAGKDTIQKHKATYPKMPSALEAKISTMSYTYLSRIETQEGLRKLYYTLCIESDLDRLVHLLNLYREYASFMYKNPDKNRLFNGVIDYVIYKVNKQGVNEALRLFKRAEVYDNSDSLYDDVVELTTIHGAKGREWKYVIILADDNVSFPNLSSISKMREQGVSFENISKWVDEERRLHYVAFTRAKEQLAVFANSDNLSIFTLECLGMNGGNELIIKSALNEIPQSIIDYSRKCFEDERYKYDLTAKRMETFENFAKLQ